jgi:hypothetical protein
MQYNHPITDWSKSKYFSSFTSNHPILLYIYAIHLPNHSLLTIQIFSLFFLFPTISFCSMQYTHPSSHCSEFQYFPFFVLTIPFCSMQDNQPITQCSEFQYFPYFTSNLPCCFSKAPTQSLIAQNSTIFPALLLTFPSALAIHPPNHSLFSIQIFFLLYF